MEGPKLPEPEKLEISAPAQVALPVEHLSEVVKELPVDNSLKMKALLLGFLVVVLGVGTGYLFSGASAGWAEPAPAANVIEESKSASGVSGEVFSDTARGILNEGGTEGEGTHYLDTGFGDEKYVYLLSTVLDLGSFVGKKVEVSGQTLAAEHAGWLMDVGRVKVIE